MTCLATLNDLFRISKWLVYQSSRLLPVGFRTVASTSYIPMTVPTRSSVNMLLLATHTSIIPSFWKETRDTARSSSYPLMTYKGWTNGLQNSGYASNKKYASSLQSIIEKNNLQKYDQMVRSVWTSTRTSKEKNSRLRTTTAKLCLRWQYSKAKRVSRFSLRLSPLWTRRQGRKSNTMTTVWCPKSDARSITYILNCRFTMCLMWRKPTCRRLVRNSTRSWRQLQEWTDLWIRVMTSFPCHG